MTKINSESFLIVVAYAVVWLAMLALVALLMSCGPEEPLMEKRPSEYCGENAMYVEEHDECIGEANMFTVCTLLDEKLFELPGNESIDDMIILTCKLLAVWEASGGLEKAE